MEILAHYPLVEYNTFRVSAKARWWINYDSVSDLDLLSRDEFFHSLSFICLGGGSNVLFLEDYSGAIVHSRIATIDVLDADRSDEVLLRVGSGLDWDTFVSYCLQQGYYGLENLSGIPGTVGASAVQNIGAYGVEAGQCIDQVACFRFSTGAMELLSREQCHFAYRSSIFKTPDFSGTTIPYVYYRLKRAPGVNLCYRALSDFFLQHTSSAPTPHAVREAVLRIRNSKLPDPKDLPNAGSFFQNPIVPQDCLEKLQQRYPAIPFYPLPDDPDRVKLSAAWLIDQAGWKGKREGNVGCYPKQPLVLVNYGTEKGSDIAHFARLVQGAVLEQFGVSLQPEVRYIASPTSNQ